MIVESTKNSFLRGKIAVDDVLDALVVAYTTPGASLKLRTIPEAKGYDTLGVPMKMVYYIPDRSN